MIEFVLNEIIEIFIMEYFERVVIVLSFSNVSAFCAAIDSNFS